MSSEVGPNSWSNPFFTVTYRIPIVAVPWERPEDRPEEDAFDALLQTVFSKS